MEALDDLRAVLLAGGVLHLGFATVALAYVFRDVLSLRVLAAAGYGLFLVHTLPETALADRVEAGWYALFLILNVGHAAVLAYERRCASLTPDERRLSGLAFASVDAAGLDRSDRGAALVPMSMAAPGKVTRRPPCAPGLSSLSLPQSTTTSSRG